MIDGPPPEGTTPAEQAPPDMATAFEQFLNGDLKEAEVGLWRLERGTSTEHLAMYYQDSAAIYGFNITEEDNLITVFNFHRNAQKGKGTPTLREIERNLTLLAAKTGKKVHVSFRKFGQEDTAVWLTKNGYTFNSSMDTFEKTLA